VHAADFGVCVVEEDVNGFAEDLVRAWAPLGCSSSAGSGGAGSWTGGCDCHCAGWIEDWMNGMDGWMDGWMGNRYFRWEFRTFECRAIENWRPVVE